MAINNTYKSARLLQSRRYTHDAFTDGQEAFTSTLDINANEVYIDQALIPSSSLPFSGSAQSGSIYSVDGLPVVKYWHQKDFVHRCLQLLFLLRYHLFLLGHILLLVYKLYF